MRQHKPFPFFINLIFQSTHPRGMRPYRPGLPHYRCRYFNPRIRVGCDPTNRLFQTPPNDFNPRIRVGCDEIKGVISYVETDFNPRIRVGCDGFLFRNSFNSLNFNPRIRVGCDRWHFDNVLPVVISIHASAWDATNWKISHESK